MCYVCFCHLFLLLNTTRRPCWSVSWVTLAECAALPRYAGQVLRGQRLMFSVNGTSRNGCLLIWALGFFLLPEKAAFFRGFCWRQRLGILFHIWQDILTPLGLSQDKSWLKILSRLLWKCSAAHEGMRGRYYGNKGYMFSGFSPV